MISSKYDKYWYFRNETDEDNDDDFGASMMLPVDRITAMIPTSTTTIAIYFTKPTQDQAPIESVESGRVSILVNQGKVKTVIAALVADLNSGPRYGHITVIADDSTVEFGGVAGSKVAKYFHGDITNCQTITQR
jgi:hypothetical protein|tara:strand:+ start:1608 stop:2009 length:402 start_codon:yes stop_codon:yes gene_type:complete